MTKQIIIASTSTPVFPQKFELDDSISENGRKGVPAAWWRREMKHRLRRRAATFVMFSTSISPTGANPSTHRSEEQGRPNLRPNTHVRRAGPASAAVRSARPPSKKGTWEGADELQLGKQLSEPPNPSPLGRAQDFPFPTELEPVRVQANRVQLQWIAHWNKIK